MKREKREFLYGKEKKERKEFSLIVLPSQKVSYWNQEGVHSLEKLGDRKRIEKKIFGCKNQATLEPKIRKRFLVYFLIL